MTENYNPFDTKILQIFREKKYFVILQGCHGSGKQYFAENLKRYFNSFEICSFNDYFKNNTFNKKNMIEAYDYCKVFIKNCLNNEMPVLYNHTNLVEEKLEDLINLAKSKGYCVMLLKFFPSYNEDMCIEVAKYFHNQTQHNIVKQTIINDNIKFINYQNKNRLPAFGIKIELVEGTRDLKFTSISPDINSLKELYLHNGWLNKSNGFEAPFVRSRSVSPLRLPPAVEIEIAKKDKHIEKLEDKVKKLEKELEYLSIGKYGSQRRLRE